MDFGMAKKQVKAYKKSKADPKTDLTSNPDSVFFSSFIGEWVEIVCKNTSVTNNDGMFPFILAGYLLDVDSEHLYTSNDGREVTGAVKRSDYITIQVAKEYNQEDFLLNTISIPEDKETGN